MGTKICTKCNIEKELECFSFHRKATNERYTRCKDCWNAENKLRYQKNKSYYKQKANLRKQTVVLENKQRIWKYLESHPCVDCGESDPVVLQFDHVRDKKAFNIGEIANRGVGWKKIETEISKCDIRCANCHFRKTAKQQNWYVWLKK